MNLKTILAIAVIAALAGGCATSKSGSERAYDIELENEEGTVVFFINLSNQSRTDTESGDAPVDQTTSPSTALGMQGSTATASGADILIDQISSALENFLDRSQTDNSVNTNTPAPQPPAPEPEEPGQPAEPGEPEDPGDQPPVVGGEIFELDYHGRYNGDRPLWYAYRPMASFGEPFLVSVEGCGDLLVPKNDGNRYEDKQGYPGWVVKQSEVSGRGLAIHAPSSCKSTRASVYYEQ